MFHYMIEAYVFQCTAVKTVNPVVNTNNLQRSHNDYLKTCVKAEHNMTHVSHNLLSHS
jgi:hypothetical protein